MNREQIYVLLVMERCKSGSMCVDELLVECWVQAGAILEGVRLGQEWEEQQAKIAAAQGRRRQPVKES